MGQYSGLPLVCQLFISLKSLINPEYSLNLVTFLPVPYPSYGPDFSNIDRVSAQLKTAIGIGGERAGELYTGYLKPAFMDLWAPENYMAEFK